MIEEITIKNLVFEGGGVKGAAYGGVLIAMDNLGLLNNIERVAGTSAGAITACLIALGYTPNEIAEIVTTSDFSEFQDDSFGIVRDSYRLFKYYGWHKGDKFTEWMGNFIADKLGNKNATFADLHRQSPIFLYVIATNLTRQRPEIYSYETTADMPISIAIRCSMSIPIFFQCVKNKQGDIIVDGGVANNYPIQLFDKAKFMPPLVDEGLMCSEQYILNPQTIGFRLDTKEEIIANENWNNASTNIKNIKGYIGAVVSYLMEEANKRHLKNADKERTIFIDTDDVKATDFGLAPDKVRTLIENGQKAVWKYFNI